MTTLTNSEGKVLTYTNEIQVIIITQLVMTILYSLKQVLLKFYY